MNNPRVLLLDDEEELVVTLVERLALRNIEAEAFMDGQTALERMKNAPFDIIVADLKMPGLGGLEVVEIVREHYPDVKIILITGHGRYDEETETNIAGVQEILMKPFSIQTLVAAIKTALSDRES